MKVNNFILKSFAFLLIILLFFLTINSSHKTISKKSAFLEKLKLEILNKACDKKEIEYIKEFPSTFATFRHTFDNLNYNTSELYELTENCIEHLDFMGKLAKKYPHKVLTTWLDIAKGGRNTADAVSYLQKQIAIYASDNTRKFVEAIKLKNKSDQLSIIKFIADVRNFYYYDEYKEILVNLKSLNETKLLQYFVNAKKERMKHRSG